MGHHRTLRALMVDVPPAHAGVLVSVLEEAGWQASHEHAQGADGLAAALHHRGWDAVLYGGDGPGAVPARKALALVRLADPHLPFLAVSPNVRAGDLSAVVRGLDGAAAVVPDPKNLPRALTREMDATRLRRRVGGAHKLLLAQQAITDHVAAGLEIDELCARVLETLGGTLGWTYGAVWRPAEDAPVLRCTSTWHAAGSRPEVAAFAEVSRGLAYAPGQDLPGRVWAFRRPAWVADVASDGRMARGNQALRAGLTSAVAFPIALADECAGVLEFFSGGINKPNAEVAAMFATVGGQLALYLERRTAEAGESRELHAALDRTRGYLDAAGALIVALDAKGRILMANARACAAVGALEPELLGGDWFALAVPKGGRTAARAAFAQVALGEADAISHRLPSAGGEQRSVDFQATPLDDAAGVLLLGRAEALVGRVAVAIAG